MTECMVTRNGLKLSFSVFQLVQFCSPAEAVDRNVRDKPNEQRGRRRKKIKERKRKRKNEKKRRERIRIEEEDKE